MGCCDDNPLELGVPHLKNVQGPFRICVSLLWEVLRPTNSLQ